MMMMMKVLLTDTLRLMKLSVDQQAAVSRFLEEVGCHNVSDLAFLEKSDFEQSSLSLTTRRKLFLVTEYLQLFGQEALTANSTDLCLTTMMEQVRRSKTTATTMTSSSTLQLISGASTTMSDKNVIGLVVGGHKFTTTRNTLCRVPGSVLEAMFNDTKTRLSATTMATILLIVMAPTFNMCSNSSESERRCRCLKTHKPGTN